MERGVPGLGEFHYYSERARRKLEALRHARVAIVEAPPGYGKTTAVRDQLAGLQQGSAVYWLTATEELPSACFRRFARMIGRIDPEAGRRLMDADPLNAVTIGEACEAIRSIRCAGEAYLVIDNFHLLNAAAPRPFLPALMEHGGDGLRVILLTHPLNRKLMTELMARGFYHIDAPDLTLDARDIRGYFQLAGLNIAQRAADRLMELTGGWIAAVCLQLRAFREKGTFSDARDILTLMEQLVWDAFSADQQTFLLRLSPFETMTAAQIRALLELDALPEAAIDALRCPFIQYEPVAQRYELHTLLGKLLVQKRRTRGDAFDRECLWQAGRLCRDAGRVQEALGYFWQVRDYDQMLALDLSQMIFEFVGDVPFSEIAREVALHCPAAVQQAHMLSMLRVALSLLAGGMAGAFQALMGSLRGMLAALGDPPDFLGEWLLLASLGEQPRLARMIPLLRQAEALLPGRWKQSFIRNSGLKK